LNENGFAGRIAFLGALHVNNGVSKHRFPNRNDYRLSYLCMRFFRTACPSASAMVTCRFINNG